jgi:hypothetical protein
MRGKNAKDVIPRGIGPEQRDGELPLGNWPQWRGRTNGSCQVPGIFLNMV